MSKYQNENVDGTTQVIRDAMEELDREIKDGIFKDGDLPTEYKKSDLNKYLDYDVEFDESNPKWVKIIRCGEQDTWYCNYLGDIFKVRGIRGSFLDLDNHHSDKERSWWTRAVDCEAWDNEIEEFNKKLQEKCEHGLFTMTCRICYEEQ